MSVNEVSFVTELFGIRLNVRFPAESPLQVPQNAVSISSARTTKRFPSRCASAIQIIRSSESMGGGDSERPSDLLALTNFQIDRTAFV
jgi:hypothetical protein